MIPTSMKFGICCLTSGIPISKWKSESEFKACLSTPREKGGMANKIMNNSPYLSLKAMTHISSFDFFSSLSETGILSSFADFSELL